MIIVTKTNIHIPDSFDYPKKTFKGVLEMEKKLHPDCDVFFRSMFSLQMEWATHNLLYILNIQRARTKDVDLDYPSDHPEWMYNLLGLISWIFIK